jgi:hypothetical protein
MSRGQVRIFPALKRNVISSERQWDALPRCDAMYQPTLLESEPQAPKRGWVCVDFSGPVGTRAFPDDRARQWGSRLS